MIKKFLKKKRTKGYYQLGNRIVDCSKGLVYNTTTNLFEEYSEFLENDFYREDKLTKQEFDNLFQNKICDCEVGQKRKIEKGQYYDLEKMFREKYPNRTDIEIIVHDQYKYVYIFKYKGEFLYQFEIQKEACLNCHSCLSKKRVYKTFEKIIEKVKQKELIEKICE